MLIDPFRLCVAVLPLAIYCVLLALVNLWPRPILTTGARDLAALGAGLSGLVIIGPLELFMPTAAGARFGQYVWLFLLALYGLSVTFVVLLSRPRLVVYNITTDQLRPILAQVVTALDPDARWAGDNLALPGLAIQLHLDSFPAMRHVSLVASGHQQDFRGWQQLERMLAAALHAARVPPNPRAASLIGFAGLLVVGCLYYVLTQPQALAEGWHDMLRH